MRRSRAAGLAVVAVVAGALLADPAFVLRRLAWLAADPVRFGLALVAFALVRPLLAWPATLIGLVAGYGFGLAGAPVAVVLLGVTALPPYLFARRVGGPEIPSEGRAARLLSVADRVRADAGDRRAVTAARLLPTPSDAVSLAAGAGGVPLRPFLVGTLLGEGPWALAGALAGAELGSLAAGTDVSVDARLVVVATLVAGLLLVGPAYRVYAESRG
ncbi:MAG: TVP38/TMEM64 family protein [Haloferacaceae archaeon]